MITKVESQNNNCLAIDTKNKNIHIWIWNSLEKKFNTINVDFDPKNLKSIVEEEEIKTKKEIIKVNKVAYKVKPKNNYPLILGLLKEYEPNNYTNYTQRSIKEENYDDEWIPETYESYDQLFYKGIRCFRLQ